MIVLRSLLYQIVLIGSSLICSILVLIIGWGGYNHSVGRIGRYWAYTNLWALKYLCGLDYRIQGMEHFPANESVVVLCKHQSAWETIALRAFLPINQSWVLKQELLRIPFFGWALARFRPIAIDRSAGRREITKLLREGTAQLDAGRPVVVFPEGTRVAPGVRHPYGVGGALLAERSGRAVVPIAHNAGVFWGRRSFIKRPGTVEMVIGPIIETQGRKATEINALTEAWIEAKMTELPNG